MTGVPAALIRAHEANIQHYSRLLYKRLSASDRVYVRKRLEEERAALKRLKEAASGRQAASPAESGGSSPAAETAAV